MNRQLSKEGHIAYEKAHVATATLLSVVWIFYAAFRGQRIITQLPATYSTTISPKTLSFTLFNVQLPDATYEFPNITFCGLSNFTCSLSSAIVSTQCNYTSSNSCFTLVPTHLHSVNDYLTITPYFTGANGLNGGLAEWGDYYMPIEANHQTTILITKTIILSISNAITTSYVMETYALPSNSSSAIVKYLNFQMTYQKSFLPLDTNNWLGEIGGVAALLFFLYMFTMMIVKQALLKNNMYSDSMYAKAANEAFDQFS